MFVAMKTVFFIWRVVVVKTRYYLIKFELANLWRNMKLLYNLAQLPWSLVMCWSKSIWGSVIWWVMKKDFSRLNCIIVDFPDNCLSLPITTNQPFSKRKCQSNLSQKRQLAFAQRQHEIDSNFDKMMSDETCIFLFPFS